jgi:AAA15 family ATPase/GTPase
MNKIKQIKLKHFKFFYGEVNIDLERHNAVVYGENGSGKSSIYWALYTFLQSVFKSDNAQIQKYFKPEQNENLRNRFAEDIEESYIKLVFEDDVQTVTEKTISNTTVNTKTDNLIRLVVEGSELINYKLLYKIQDFKNDEQIDLFKLMDKDTLMFINFRQQLQRHDGSTGTTNAQDWWEYIKPGMQPRGRMHEQSYKTFSAAVDIFNEELKFYLDSIIESANHYLKKFKQVFTIRFEYVPGSYDAFESGSTTKRNHKTIAPEIIIYANFDHRKLSEPMQQISRPHIFLNEAKLTAIGLSIRFAMLDKKVSDSNMPKFLVLDDLLISLDMSNRDVVLETILNDFTNYQLIILTHDRFFFELLRHRTKQVGHGVAWKYIEMYEYEKNGILQPLMFESESRLGLAESYLKKGRLEIAGNLLRKVAEHFIKSFLPDRHKFDECERLKPLKVLLDKAVIFVKQCQLDSKLFEDLKGHTKFLLNNSSHDSYDVPLFRAELENCLTTIKEINKIKNEPFLKQGEQVEFELTDGTDIYKFEIKIEDDFRLLQEPGKNSVISKGMLNYWITKNGTKGPLQHGQGLLKKMYENCYAKSDKTKNPDFWEEIIISSTGEKLKTVRKF